MPIVSQQQQTTAGPASVAQNALSRISEDSPRPGIPHRCLNITGIEKYPELQGALPRAWSVPALAPHVRANLEAPLVRKKMFYSCVKVVRAQRHNLQKIHFFYSVDWFFYTVESC